MWHGGRMLDWILMKQNMIGWQWQQLGHTQIICTSLQTDNHSIFYRPDALPDAQPTVSKALKAKPKCP